MIMSGLIHTRIQTLSYMPNFTPSSGNITLQNIDEKYIDEKELATAFEDVDFIDAGGAPSEKGENK